MITENKFDFWNDDILKKYFVEEKEFKYFEPYTFGDQIVHHINRSFKFPKGVEVITITDLSDEGKYRNIYSIFVDSHLLCSDYNKTDEQTTWILLYTLLFLKLHWRTEVHESEITLIDKMSNLSVPGMFNAQKTKDIINGIEVKEDE